jgi:deazaflavin-dependent oxidoreductase (nitroreductase family)
MGISPSGREDNQTMNQRLLDRIRVLNKYVINKLLIHISGKDLGMFAILTHTGRKSGKLYQIPIIVVPVPNGFVIALTYGRKTDWYENVKAKGGCSLKWKRQELALTHPEFIDQPQGLQAFPALFRLGLKSMGIQDYLHLSLKALN